MTSPLGFPVWFDLFTAQAPAAIAFYGKLFGWETTSMPSPAGGTYSMFVNQGAPISGITPPSDPALANQWIAYVAVPNLDAAVATITKHGGTLLGAIEQIPTIGRWAFARDPQGAIVAPFEQAPAQVTQTPERPPMAAVGAPCWHELMCTDHRAALAFYHELFGWTAGEAIDMGPMGTYQTYGHGTQMIGGMMNLTPEMPSAPYWIEYFRVADVDTAAAQAIALGAQPTFPAMNVSNNTGRIAGFVDPTGTQFAMWALLAK